MLAVVRSPEACTSLAFSGTRSSAPLRTLDKHHPWIGHFVGAVAGIVLASFVYLLSFSSLLLSDACGCSQAIPPYS